MEVFIEIRFSKHRTTPDEECILSASVPIGHIDEEREKWQLGNVVAGVVDELIAQDKAKYGGFDRVQIEGEIA